MAVKTAQYIFNGQAYNLTYNSTSGKWEATVTAPSKSSYNQPDHVLGGTVKATDAAGNTTTVDQSHATLGASLKLRVKEKTAPTITITSPSVQTSWCKESVISMVIISIARLLQKKKEHIYWK